MFGILDRYIGKTILHAIMLTLFMLTALSSIIRFIEQLRRINENYTALSGAYYSLLMVPKDIELFFPIAALLGALIGLGKLASKSELIVMETAGFSRINIAKAVMKTAIPLVLLTMAIGEWIAPASEQFARNMYSEKTYGHALIATQNSIWAKDGENFVHISLINSDGIIQNVDIYTIEKGRLTKLTHAATGQFENNVWKLNQVDESDLTDLKRIKGRSLMTMAWETTISPDKLGLVVLDPESLSMTGLYHYIKYLNHNSQDALNYKLFFWKKIFKPLSFTVMMLMAISFIFGPLRSVSMGLRILTGIVFGFLFYICDMLFSQLSLIAGFNPIMGALLTSLLFFILSILLLYKKR